MADSKLLLFVLFLALVFSKFIAQLSDPDAVKDFPTGPQVSDNSHKVEQSDSNGGNDVTLGSEVDYSSLKLELDQLKSKIPLLESSIDEKSRELESKDESIKRMEKIIQDRSTKLALLQGEMQSIQETGSLHAKELVHKAQARVGELEKQVNSLRKEIETQNKKRDALEAQANVAEKKVQELTMKLENLERINNEQKSRIRKTERALLVAKEEMMKAKLEATHNFKELREVHEAWLPPWFAAHLAHCQSHIVTQWHEHGKPALDVAVQKALEKKAQVEKWAAPHINTFKTKWIPHIKERYSVFITNIEPHVQSLAAKTAEVYHTSKKSIEPHVMKVQQKMEPYYQEAGKFTKPYFDQVWAVTKPHVDKASAFFKPHKKKVLRGYKKFLRATTKYHRQVQAAIDETLKRNELTKPLATIEIAWFVASAVIALPVLFLIQMSSNIFSKKAKKKHPRNAHASHTRRRAKRNHPDKGSLTR